MDKQFFQMFLMFSQIQTVAIIAVLFVSFYILKKMRDKKVNFALRMLFALFIVFAYYFTLFVAAVRRSIIIKSFLND